MRILQIADWTSNPGGIEVCVARLRETLSAGGDDVRLLTGSTGSQGDGTADYVALASDRLAPQIGLQLVNPFAVARLRAALREFRPDVVHVHMLETNLSTALFLALRGVPTVVSVHFYKPICPVGTKVLPDGTFCAVPAGTICFRGGCQSLPAWLRDRPRYRLLRDGLARARRVITSSRWMEAHLAVSGIAADVVYPPVADTVAAAARAADPLFVYCGRLSAEKGVQLFVRAFARVLDAVPEARARVVGGGPEHAALEALAGRLGVGDAVDFVGRMPPDQVAGYVADAWALVAPSLWAEPFGLVAAEAIAQGVPVVASATGGFAETVEPALSGILCANGSEQELADALRAIAARPLTVDPQAIARIRARHSLERHGETMRSIYSAAAA
ncbi:MAG: hypothetical protein QOG29_1438 [Gaiellaceae bacterium]|nr:hypothetical protein [Gaiellaceae bacterium]